LPSYRMAPALARALADGTGLPTRRYDVLLREAGGAIGATVAARVRALGGTVDLVPSRGVLLSATLTVDQVVEVAGFDEVVHVDLWSPPEVDLDLARAFSGVDHLESVAGYTGQGVRGEVIDGNV